MLKNLFKTENKENVDNAVLIHFNSGL